MNEFCTAKWCFEAFDGIIKTKKLENAVTLQRAEIAELKRQLDLQSLLFRVKNARDNDKDVEKEVDLISPPEKRPRIA